MEYLPPEHDEVIESLRSWLTETYAIAIRRSSPEKLSRLDDLLSKVALEILTGK